MFICQKSGFAADRRRHTRLLTRRCLIATTTACLYLGVLLADTISIPIAAFALWRLAHTRVRDAR